MPNHPLTGIRVIEVANYMAGPFCAMQLADLGADVIKVENPDGGDTARDSAPFLDGESSPFIRLNRNKRSLAMNLKAPAGKELFRQLVEGADVVVENLRPGTMGDLELDYPRLAALNPRLVYVAASGWGQTGPYSQLAGLDIMAQAMSGLMSITGEPNGNPVKVGVPICDLVCALYGTIGALSALRVREETGRGQFIDVSLFESGVSLEVWEAGRYFATGEVPGPLGSAHQTSAPYQAVRAADGYFTVSATTPRNWRSFCDVLDHPEWASEERFKDNPSRHARRDILIPMIEQITSRRPRADWVSLLQKAGVPCAEIQTYDQVFNDPQLQARGFFWKGRHSKLGDVEQIGSPIHFSDTPVRQGRAGPGLGEHTSEVLRALGSVRVPTIAAIAGACTGGGAGIAAACDLRICTPSLKFGFPIARTLGNTLSMANFARLTMLIGAARVKDLIFMARLVGADEAAAIGLVSEVVPSEEALEPRVMEICSTVSANAPLTLETAKEALRRIRVQMTPPDGGSDLLIKAYMSEDFREGIEAFFAKRPARWKGR